VKDLFTTAHVEEFNAFDPRAVVDRARAAAGEEPTIRDAGPPGT
jgi:hypothetical protein